MNNLLSYCGLTDARMSTSEKDLPVSDLKVFVENIIIIFLADFLDKQHALYTQFLPRLVGRIKCNKTKE